jgi:ribonuclease R
MDMEQNILDIIKSSDKALSVYELYDALALNNVDDLKSLLKTLNRMEDNFKVYRTKKDNYMLFSNSHLKICTMIGNKKGFGFVNVDDSNIDIFVAPSNMNNAIDKDRVIVEVINEKGTNSPISMHSQMNPANPKMHIKAQPNTIGNDV